jgi:phospholipid/cholesterol/gamma-HCH transport system substrate-binding protein
LVQAKLLQSFENYDIAHAPLRAENLSDGGLRLVIDIRQFEISLSPHPQAIISFSAKILDAGGHLKAAKIFQETVPMNKVSVPEATAAFNKAFGALVQKLVLWTADAA